VVELMATWTAPAAGATRGGLFAQLAERRRTTGRSIIRRSAAVIDPNHQIADDDLDRIKGMVHPESTPIDVFGWQLPADTVDSWGFQPCDQIRVNPDDRAEVVADFADPEALDAPVVNISARRSHRPHQGSADVPPALR